MALPNYLASIKSSGLYRFVWDKSQVPPAQAETMRLMIGYSERGPFNTPVYCESTTDFISTFGNISKRLERRGIFFHRLCLQALSAGPILALNLKPFTSEQVDTVNIDFGSIADESKYNGLGTLTQEYIVTVYNTNKFWTIDPDTLPTQLNTDNYMTLAHTDTRENSTTIFIRKANVDGYNLSLRDWYNNMGEEVPGWMEPILDTNLSDYFVDVYAFKGKFTQALCTGEGVLAKYFTGSSDADLKINTGYKDAFGDNADALNALANDPSSNFINKYTGCTIPYFKDGNGNYISIDLLFNADNVSHKMVMKLDEGKLEDKANSESAETSLIKALEIGDAGAVIESEEGAITYPAISPNYFKGYEYVSDRQGNEASGEKLSGINLQAALFPVLGYKGIRKALTNRVDVEYHYIVDTFESYVQTGLKAQLASVAMEKDNVFAILNFPKAQLFQEFGSGKFMNKTQTSTSPYARPYLDFKLVTASGSGFDLVSKVNGASWCGYFSPLVLSDGTVKTVFPSAALVSNNFMTKWTSRHPYDCVAGPNFGVMSWEGLQGPDYSYSQEDRDTLEPFGVNVMVYVPRQGTYINSNQTAQQNPVTALSKINVRELVIYIQDSVEDMMRNYMWSLNTQSLRDNLKTGAESILQNIQDNGGLYAYNVVCDETNNTPDVIDNEMVLISIHIEAARGTGKMCQELTLYRTGGLSSTVS